MVTRVFLDTLRCFMKKEEFHLPEHFSQMEELYLLAQEHKVQPIVYEQICKQVDHNRLTGWKRDAMMRMMSQVQREAGFLAIYHKMLEAGIKPLVLKGIVCRNLYEKPDYRVSSDEDVLVREEDFWKCDQILLQAGFHRIALPEDEMPDEVGYRNENGIYIELHVKLFAEDTHRNLNLEFADAFSNCVCETIRGNQIWTLAPTQHLFYLICHSFKHFIGSGVGIRQFCDIVMMAEHYANAIDWYHIIARLECLHMKDYWDSVVKIGVAYLGFSLEKAGYPLEMWNAQVDCEPMLLDVLQGGIYGDSSKARLHSANVTLTAVSERKEKRAKGLWKSLFPKVAYMKKRFSWVERMPWLLPAGYVVRILQYLCGKKSVKDSWEIGVHRTELLRKYHIIE